MIGQRNRKIVTLKNSIKIQNDNVKKSLTLLKNELKHLQNRCGSSGTRVGLGKRGSFWAYLGSRKKCNTKQLERLLSLGFHTSCFRFGRTNRTNQ